MWGRSVTRIIPKTHHPYSTMEKDYNIEFDAKEVSLPSRYFLRLKKHLARLWWAYLGLCSLSFLVTILCLIYIIIPRLVQQNVDNSYLLCTDLTFAKPTTHSVTVNQSALLYTKTHFTPTLKPFTASLYLVDNDTYSSVPISTLRFPEIHALHPVSFNSLENAVLNFDSEAALAEVTKFSVQFMNREVVKTALVGEGKVSLGSLPEIKVKYNQTLSFRGLSGLKGFNITDIRLNLNAQNGEPNMSGLAVIPNPSVLTVELGNVTFTVLTARAGKVGNSIIENVKLSPGTNKFVMKSYINQTKIAQSMDISSGIVKLLIRGDSSVYNGQHLPYFEKALASNSMVIPLNVTAVLAHQ